MQSKEAEEHWILGAEDFAPGVRGDAHLRTVLDRTGAQSLSDLVKKR